jgi:hypothetical protein
VRASWLERTLRQLLRLYPSSFRSVLGEDLVATFESERRRSGSGDGCGAGSGWCAVW